MNDEMPCDFRKSFRTSPQITDLFIKLSNFFGERDQRRGDQYFSFIGSHGQSHFTVNNQNYAVGSQIPNELVCMVNNAYMGKPQIAVPVNDKTYYGCCQMCVGTLNNDETARTAIDPFSNKKVDKTEAYIVLMKAEGDVSYFETKENYLKYK